MRPFPNGVNQGIDARQKHQLPRLLQHQRIRKIVDILGRASEMEKFGHSGNLGARSDGFLQKILDRLDIVIRRRLDLLDAHGLGLVKVIDQGIEKGVRISGKGRYLGNAVYRCQMLQPAHLDGHPGPDQTEFTEDRPQGLHLAGITAVQRGKGGQRRKIHRMPLRGKDVIGAAMYTNHGPDAAEDLPSSDACRLAGGMSNEWHRWRHTTLPAERPGSTACPMAQGSPDIAVDEPMRLGLDMETGFVDPVALAAWTPRRLVPFFPGKPESAPPAPCRFHDKTIALMLQAARPVPEIALHRFQTLSGHVAQFTQAQLALKKPGRQLLAKHDDRLTVSTGIDQLFHHRTEMISPPRPTATT